MNKLQLFEKLEHSELPVIVEFWAPWCGPCRAMAPALKRAAQEYQGKVELLRINADEAQELVRELGVLGIPTLIGYDKGKQLFRKTGAQTLEALQALFAAALAGEPARRGPSSMDRLLRVGSGTVLVAIGLYNPSAWLLLPLGGALMFSAVYDRCPIVQAIAPRIKSLLKIRA
jgi:thioredoxin 1